jgi:hypothetical protein
MSSPQHVSSAETQSTQSPNIVLAFAPLLWDRGIPTFFLLCPCDHGVVLFSDDRQVPNGMQGSLKAG